MGKNAILGSRFVNGLGGLGEYSMSLGEADRALLQQAVDGGINWQLARDMGLQVAAAQAQEMLAEKAASNAKNSGVSAVKVKTVGGASRALVAPVGGGLGGGLGGVVQGIDRLQWSAWLRRNTVPLALATAALFYAVAARPKNLRGRRRRR